MEPVDVKRKSHWRVKHRASYADESLVETLMPAQTHDPTAPVLVSEA